MNQSLTEINNDKENNTPNKEYQNREDYDFGLENKIKTSFRNSYMPKVSSILRKNLERIDEKEYEENYKSSKNEVENDFEVKNSQEIIINLKEKIIELENQIINLRKKNEYFENDLKVKRFSYIGTRRKYIIGLNGDNNNIEISNLIKEKNDLQEMNEKMLNMLTEKEMENEELIENFDTYKANIKNEIKNYLDMIKELQEKNEIYENHVQNKENFEEQLEEMIKEYNSYKERMEKSLNEYIKKEEEFNLELENKENCIQNLKNEIKNLEFENIQLQNQKEEKEKINEKELSNIDIIISENEKLKNEISFLQEKISKNDEKSEMAISTLENEIKILNQDLEYNKKNNMKIKVENAKEKNILKNEISKCNKDLNNLIKKNEEIKRQDEELKEKINILQNKLERKTKEMQDINDSAKKLIENKEDLIKKYEDKIEELNKDKNLLIEQNHELLDKMNYVNSNNLGDILNEKEENINNNENIILLNTEIKTLKEKLENQTHELISLKAMEEECKFLKIEKDKLIEDNNKLKEKINKQKLDLEEDSLMNTIKKQYNVLRMSSQMKNSLNNKKDISLTDKIFYEKQIEALKIMKENEKNLFSDEIDKLKGDFAILKVKYLNQNLENETLIIKYKNIIKTIYQECNKRGIKLNLINIKNI